MSRNANYDMLDGYADTDVGYHFADPDASYFEYYADTDADLCFQIMSLCYNKASSSIFV